MKYSNYGKVPDGKIVWGCGYEANSNQRHLAINKKPVRGKIVDGFFYELDSDEEIRENTKVSARTRSYSDTKEESIEIYNSKVKERISFLKSLIRDIQDCDFI